MLVVVSRLLRVTRVLVVLLLPGRAGFALAARPRRRCRRLAGVAVFPRRPRSRRRLLWLGVLKVRRHQLNQLRDVLFAAPADLPEQDLKGGRARTIQMMKQQPIEGDKRISSRIRRAGYEGVFRDS